MALLYDKILMYAEKEITELCFRPLYVAASG